MLDRSLTLWVARITRRPLGASRRSFMQLLPRTDGPLDVDADPIGVGVSI